MVGRTAGGVRSLEEQIVNSRAPEIMIYLRTYLRASFHWCSINSLHACSTLVLYEQARIAATRLVWAARLSIATRLVEHFQMVKCTVKQCV